MDFAIDNGDELSIVLFVRGNFAAVFSRYLFMEPTTMNSPNNEVKTGFDHRATYCPEDNKLRFYPDWSDPDFDKEEFKSVGYRWASKQEIYVCPSWSPTAEDKALEFVSEIEDENYSPAERSADRAERFEGYREKRTNEAEGFADTFDSSDSAIGYQNAKKADREAKKIDRVKTKALTQWDKAEYWTWRTAGVIADRLYKERPDVRRRRIKKLETSLRKAKQRRIENAEKWDNWKKVCTLDGANLPIRQHENPAFIGVSPGSPDAAKLAYALANSYCWHDFNHPRIEDLKTSLYSLLTHDSDPITPAEASEIYCSRFDKPEPESRWTRHYENRLTYEKAMLQNEGGAMTDNKLEAGGKICGRLIERVNVSNSSKKPVSVLLWNDSRPCNIESMGAGGYEPPTESSLAELAELKKQRTAEKKAKAKLEPPKPKLVNPTLETAKQLQTLINAIEYRKGSGIMDDGENSPEVLEMTQARYSAYSKGAYSHYSVEEITENFEIFKPSYYGGSNHFGRSVCFKVRMASKRVIVITDKPQKKVPFDLVDKIKAEKPTVEKVRSEILKLEKMPAWSNEFSAEQLPVWEACLYLGLARSSSLTQFGLTEKGIQIFREEQAKAIESGELEPVSINGFAKRETV